MSYTTIFNSTKTSLVMNTCASNCSIDCIAYTTPLEQCYQPSVLFPGDTQWGTFDTIDSYVDATTVKRSFYKSTDGTCKKNTEVFIIPLHEKVGPIGDPRPCGEFYYKLF